MTSDPTLPSLLPADPALVPQPVKPTLTAAQRKFQKLSAEIERSRLQLRDLQALVPRLQARFEAELIPLYDRLTAARAARVRAIDAALESGVKLGRRQREDLVDWLTEECDALLLDAAEPDAGLVEIYDRHSDHRWQEMDSERAAFDRKMTEGLARAQFGDDIVDGVDAEDADELMRAIFERLEQRASDGAERAQASAGPEVRRKPGKREQAHQARLEREAKEGSQSVRDIYRKLASALHPDREADPARRAERTALMQRVNIAYEAGDLLGLLTLQHEAEGLAGIDATALPEDRLAVFLRVLGEQLVTLNREIAGLVQYLADAAGPGGRIRWTARENEADFERHLREVRQELKQLESEVARATGRATVKDYLRELVERMRVEPDDEW
jgi:hypothetical protein